MRLRYLGQREFAIGSDTGLFFFRLKIVNFRIEVQLNDEGYFIGKKIYFIENNDF